jgi:hypothetical protein
MTLAALFGSGDFWQYWVVTGGAPSDAIVRAINQESWQFSSVEGLASETAFRFLRRPRLHRPP